MKRKAYVRVTERFTHLVQPLEVIAGVELSELTTVDRQYAKLRDTLKSALSPTALNNYSDAAIAASVELAIKKHHPLVRSWFIEVGRGDMDQYVQVFEQGD